MKPYKWRTIIANAVYGCSKTGSDDQGNGSRDSPYKTAGRCWRATLTKPTTIVLRGYFSEDMADGDHRCVIRGDYWGAATFDGQDMFLIYGFTHIDMFVKNCIAGQITSNAQTGSGLFAGVGRALNAGNVGNALNVIGVAGSPVLMDRTGLYYGVVGGTTAVSNNIYSRLKSNSTHPISLGGRESPISLTVCGVRIANRRKKITTQALTYSNCIFADFDIFIDDVGVALDGCLIAADCKWYFGSIEIVITGSTSQERYDSLISQATALGVTSFIGLENCFFSTQTKDEIFNNPDKCDYTLKLDSHAIRGIGQYYGALPPAIDVPIMDDSEGVKETWDENSVAGCIAVVDDTICLDDTHIEITGEILSKIVRFNPTEINLNGIFADFSSKFTGYYANLSDRPSNGDIFDSSQILPIGRYVVKGSIVYEGENYGQGAILVVTDENTSFTDTNSHSAVIEILDPNIEDVIYLRELPYIFVRIESADGLERGATYFNYGNESITYRGRAIVSGESFVAANNVDSFTGSAGYKIGIMFDDSRVPSAEWIPAQMWGEYFVWKQGGVVQVDGVGVPISSGNYLSYQTTANGGYSNQLIKSVLTTAYVQFKLAITRFEL